MAAPFHTKVHVHSIKNERENRTMAFSIPNGMTKAQVEGRVVTVDPTVPCGMKLTGEGDPIVARIDVFEDRGVITAQFSFTDLVPVKDGDALAQGDTAVGAANGEVKKAGTNNPNVNFVAEILTIKGKKYASLVKMS